MMSSMVLPLCQKGVTMSGMSRMTGITIKLPEATLRRLRLEAQATGRSVGQLIRERLEGRSVGHDPESIHALVSDLASSVAGSRRPASNNRSRFRRS